MKKLFASMFIAGLLLSGVVGCGSTATTAPAPSKADPKAEVEKAKKAVADAEKALADEKDDKKKEELKKKVDDAKAALKKAEDAAK